MKITKTKRAQNLSTDTKKQKANNAKAEKIDNLWKKYPPHRRAADPIKIIQTFMIDRINKKPPSLNFIKWIEACLNLWAESDGDFTIDEVMGIKSHKRGKGNALALDRAKERDWAIYSDMAYLIALGLEIKTAAFHAHEKLIEAKKRNPKIRVISLRQMENEYANWPHRAEIEAYVAANIKPDYLKTFPRKPRPEDYKKKQST